MSSQSLYRKWRSQTFAEVVGQDHVTRTLLNALRTGRVAHAYLFCGPRGTGKTSTARLLAKAINCQRNEGKGEPCNTCESCRAITEGRSMDIVEIDGASNRNIDDIRELREKINFAPGLAQRKVYIIDEVHQLTDFAFNALLKTLEEPPPHAIFVLASTEAHKIPATILSRCQRFDFRRIPVREMVGRLQEICAAEGIQVELEALEAISRAATGSLRDAESVLDQLRAFVGGDIRLTDVEALLGTGGSAAVHELVSLLFARDMTAGLRLINRLADEGTDMRQLARDLVDQLRSVLLAKSEASAARSTETDSTWTELVASVSLEEVLRALKIFSRVDPAVRGLVQPQLPLEMAFAEYAVGAATPAPESRPVAVPARPVSTTATTTPGPVAPATSSGPSLPRVVQPRVAERTRPEEARPVRVAGPAAAAPSVPEAPKAEAPIAPETAPAEPVEPLTVERVREAWPRIIESVARADRKLQALLRDCSGPERVDGRTVFLGFAYPFHKEKMEQESNRAAVETAISGAVGQSCLIRCELTSRQAKQRQASPLEDPLVKEALSQGARVKGLKTTPETENTGP